MKVKFYEVIRCGICQRKHASVMTDGRRSVTEIIYIGKHEREALNTILRPISFTKVAFIEVN